MLAPRPTQLVPPGEGGGFVQVRIRKRCPPPHMAEHFDQELHTEYPPSKMW